MSILSLRPGRTERHEPIVPHSPSPYAPPRARSTGPHQLGNVTLQNVDELTGMSAGEIEALADQVEEAARHTADVLREAARRVRHAGIVANERLANFVRVASTCADAARMMQESVALRNEVQPEPAAPPAETKPEAEVPAAKTDLDMIAAEIAQTAAAVSGAPA